MYLSVSIGAVTPSYRRESLDEGADQHLTAHSGTGTRPGYVAAPHQPGLCIPALGAVNTVLYTGHGNANSLDKRVQASVS